MRNGPGGLFLPGGFLVVSLAPESHQLVSLAPVSVHQQVVIAAIKKRSDGAGSAGFGCPCFHVPIGQPILEVQFFEPQPFLNLEVRNWNWWLPFNLPLNW